MSEVLVLIDHVDGAVRKPTYELLTIAKRFGEPSAVYIGPAGQAADVTEKVKKYGAEKVYVVDDAQVKGYLVAPKAEVLQQVAEKASPAARSRSPAAPSTTRPGPSPSAPTTPR